MNLATDVRMKNSPNLEKGVQVGGSDSAREAAVKDVDAFMRRHLKACISSALSIAILNAMT